MGIDFRPLFWAGVIIGIIAGGVLLAIFKFFSAHLTIGWS